MTLMPLWRLYLRQIDLESTTGHADALQDLLDLVEEACEMMRSASSMAVFGLAHQYDIQVLLVQCGRSDQGKSARPRRKSGI